MNLHPLHGKVKILTTGLPGKFHPHFRDKKSEAQIRLQAIHPRAYSPFSKPQLLCLEHGHDSACRAGRSGRLQWHRWQAPSTECWVKLLPPPLPTSSPQHRGRCQARGPHLENDDPGIADVVKVDGALVGVGAARAAHVVVAVPVDAEPTGVEVLAARPEVVDVVLGQAALAALLLERRDLMAAHDAVVPRQGADEGHLVVLLRLVVGGQSHVPLSARVTEVQKRGEGEGSPPRCMAGLEPPAVIPSRPSYVLFPLPGTPFSTSGIVTKTPTSSLRDVPGYPLLREL